MELGERIQYHRMDKDLSVENVSKEIGLAIGSFRAIEQSRRFPSARSFHKIQEFLELGGSWKDDITWMSPDGESFTFAKAKGHKRPTALAPEHVDYRMLAIEALTKCSQEKAAAVYLLLEGD